ncbi:hypothetical protein HYDPIDRAFT_177873 [Hydnomerulius pinastri MD-312]|uniref:Reverse transcriptase domain-containing protein n=1 Tax=Hydnomerulius pinastri MD-312 TaxID=994086 RepID=A0A0C9V262_9AGAM|nr:hypothetical protein HYDPIDRAFT_177873 [Hydnomerulius pinastri MD-312]
MLRRSDLQGYKTPGTGLKTVVTMFADDTTVYLSKSDEFETLTTILAQWCKASGAKFNISKTEIIPIGTKEHRTRLIETRELKPGSSQIPGHMNIAKDGITTRILGAWIGNETNEHAIWSPTIDKIEKSLERWEKTHPTIEGRKIIIQRTIGSMTQYLTKAQGMPKDIEKRLSKMAQTFSWDSKGNATINARMLEAAPEKGVGRVCNGLDGNLHKTIPHSPREGKDLPLPPNMGELD